MTPERWQHIKEIFYGALERPPSVRESFVDSACAGDETMRHEVSQLIAAHEETDEFLAIPAFDVAAKSLAFSDRENLIEGESIRHYTVLRAIGKGGMGEVYLAEDLRLGRKVAIKVLRRCFSSETDRLQRFEREARAASALNHPNLCTIHEVGEMVDGRPYIVMEYIEGRTLRQRISQGQLMPSEVLDIAVQVGSALAASHRAGIVHRDVKPENITLRPDGIVKVLDFGLAKLTEQQREADSTMPTQTRTQTETGMVMGTARYMSPEQARGYSVDARTDIWSLGVVIYEMTAGRVPFDGATNTDVVVSVLEREPAPLLDHVPQVPPKFQRIVTKTLRKNREERYRTIKDLCLDLKDLARELELKGTTSSTPQQFEGEQTIKLERIDTKGEHGLTGLQTSPAQVYFKEHLGGATKQYRRPVALALVGVVFVTVLMFTFWSSPAVRKIVRYSPGTTSLSESSVRVVPFTSFLGREDHADFSPDGNLIAFVWGGEKDDNRDIYVKSLSGERPLRITSDPAVDILPEWSPDGQRIAFVRIADGRFAVYTVPSLGNGAERKLLTLSAPTQKISWSPDNKFIAVSDKAARQESLSLFLFSPDTGEQHRLTSPPANLLGDFSPTFSPDGQSVAFIRAANETTADLFVMRAAGGEAKQLTTDGRLRFYDQGVVGGLAWSADSQAIVYTSEAGGSPSLWKVSAFEGHPERLSVGGVDVFYPTIAANRLAFTQIHGGTPIYQIEVPSLERPSSKPVPLIASTRSNHTPQFSPDGEKIAFESDRSGTREIWICDRDGTNSIQLTTFGGPSVGWPRWSPEGKQIVFEVKTTNNIGHIYTVNIEGGSPRRVTSETVDEGLPTWSRDGKWIYFCSNRSGNKQLWKVRAEGGQALQVTKQGGFTSFESADGKFLYYSKGPPGVWRVPVDGGEEMLVLGIPNAGGWGAWTVVDDGIYFINTAVKGTNAIDFFSFATRSVKRITVMQDVNEFVSGLVVSPDHQRILYTQQQSLAGDIMLVENFR